MTMPDAGRNLRALEKHWKVNLPDSFARLYSAFEYPFINPCEFLSVEEIMRETERWRGMLPQFLPFGHDGAENFYGFYVSSCTLSDDFPILFWEHEYDFYYPLTSSFEAFLHWCVVQGRYEAQDTFEENDPQFAEEEEQRSEFARVVGLPPSLLTAPLPRNDRELHERNLAGDSQGVHSLLQLGSACLGRGSVERARDYFARASEAAPWFADPYYLIAETYRLENDVDAAASRWWQVFLCPIALSTRTSQYDLGAGHSDVDIYEAAYEWFARHKDRLYLPVHHKSLCRLLLNGDPYDPQARFVLAEELASGGDQAGAERELLNALTLATEDDDITLAYERLITLYHRLDRPRDALLCERDVQRDN